MLSGTSKLHHYPTPPVKHVGYIIVLSLSDIAELTRQVNLLSDQLNRLSEENEALRDQLGLGAEEQVNLSPLRLKKRNELEALKEEHKLLENEVSTFLGVLCKVTFEL